MLYTNNNKKRYVDMCKEFDEEFWQEPRDDAKLFKYLYLLLYMFASKKNFFKKFEDTDYFSQFTATDLYRRFIKKYKKGERVKNLLNYVSRSIDKFKITYQNKEFNQVIGEKQGLISDEFKNSLQKSVQSSYNVGIEEDIISSLSQVNLVINQVVDDASKISCFNKSLEHNIKMSVKLSLLENITLPKEILKQREKKRGQKISDAQYISTLSKQIDSTIILWNLEENYQNLVRVLVNKVRMKLSDEINDITKAYTLPDDVIDSILDSAYAEQYDYSEVYLDD